MNREIKFRGLRTDGKGWTIGVPYFIQGEKKCFMINNCQSGRLTQDDSSFQGKDVIPESVGQFTGLKDKNGAEIYEGDKVLFTWFSYGEYETEDHYEGKIVFINGSFIFTCNHGNYPLSELNFDSESDIEVIGNITEHKDLLS